MSKTGKEEEDEEFFHDSLDRLLSSANTSCSGSPSSSESEDPNPFSNRGSPNYADGLSDLAVRVVPKFPKCVSDNYDVWISQPSSVEERRLRLLRQMGLSSDPSLVRHRPTSSAVFDSNGLPDLFGRLVSSDQLNYRNPGEGFSKTSLNSNNNNNNADNNGCDDNSCNVSGIVRSKSDGQYKSPGILSVNSGSSQSAMANEVGNGGDVIVNNNQVNNNQRKSQSHNVVLIVDKLANGLLNKPPKGKITMDSTRNGSCNSLSGLGNGEVEEGLECNGVVRIDDPENPVCTIKNLDNGKEFVVNEVREDGMWNKLKEVGTGRQLTMEEFEMSVGASPIVQELMRRQNVENGNRDTVDLNVENGHNGSGSKFNKKGSWLKSIRNVANSVTGHKERRSSDERDTFSDKGGRRSSSATDDSQDASFHGPERVRVRQYGKSHKELTMLYKSQEIQAHKGSIWTIKFSLDGKYLASAGEDCIIHVWQVVESERKGDLLFDKPEDGNLNLLFLANGSPEPGLLSSNLDGHSDKRRRGRSSISRKSVSLEHVLVPETIFALAEKPYCSFQGHLDDVLDLSWSKSQHLLSSSMDKTVRLWHLCSNSCLKIFSHNDYVTCIHFNPIDDRYFISGSLDGKVRIWSIPEHKVVDWYDLHEMVTAACYTPDGQGALVGSYKGSCHLYNTSDNKLQQRSQINLQNKKKKPHQKKITGFQFAPGSTSEVLVTSADSRIRVIDGVDLVHKFKGFRNTNSQISASLTANGKYIVCASEDSHVFVWRHEGDSWPSRSKGVTVTQSYEHFHCQDVSAAIPWPGMCETWGFQDTSSREQSGPIDQSDEVFTANHPPTPVEETNGSEHLPFASGCSNSPLYGTISTASNSYFFDRISATWPEEKLTLAAKNRSPHVSVDIFNGINCTRSAWGMVIVTAGLRGEIRTFQNFGLPVRI